MHSLLSLQMSCEGRRMITVTHLSKKYKRYSTPRGRLQEWLSFNKRSCHEPLWVLKDLNFTVKKGEAVGIVGRNGAGKSTLLRLLTGTTAPTEGKIQVQGKVTALLELGMGFHPDFTGEENAILSCEMMGMSRGEARSLLPELEKFSELGNIMKEPLKHFSSGMQMRLAFSVATLVRPDVLIVDEALAVGDAYFQHKSMRKIRSFREEGTTVLFVSHDPGAVKSICTRALLLEGGEIVKDGFPADVLDYYNALIANREELNRIEQSREGSHGTTTTRNSSKGEEGKIVEVFIADEEGKRRNSFLCGEKVVIHCRYQVAQPLADPCIGILVRDRLGNDVFGTNTANLGIELPSFPEKENSFAEVSFLLPLPFARGSYSLSCALHAGSSHLVKNYDWIDNVQMIEVLPSSEPPFAGIISLPVEVEVSSYNKPEEQEAQ